MPRFVMASVSCLRTAVLAVAATCALVRPVHAEPSTDEQRAKALFDDARALAKSGYYADACPRFEESMKLHAGIGIQFNLAECLERIGKTERARTLYADVADKAHAAGRLDRERIARGRAAALAKVPSTPEVTEVPVVILGSTPERDEQAELAKRCAEEPRAVLDEESDSLAEATAGVRLAEQSAARLSAEAPGDPRAQKARRELAAVEAELAKVWLLAGQVANQLTLRPQEAPKKLATSGRARDGL